jgi:methionyl-tRNA formyltransferase
MSVTPPNPHDSNAEGAVWHRLRLVLMGTGAFAVPAFEALFESGHDIAAVITRPAPEVKSRRGQPPAPVREFAAKHQLRVEAPPSVNTPEGVALLRSLAPDLLVVCDFGQILSNEALAVAKLGGINLHGSLLPAYRGAAPVQRALLAGEMVTGVSVIHMTPKLDGGPILASVETPIHPDETAGQLESRLAILGIAPTIASVEMLARWDGTSPLGRRQDPDRVTRAARLHKEEGRIDWRKGVEQIDWQIRGMSPWPGAFTELTLGADKPPLRIAIRKATPVEHETCFPGHAHPGTHPGTILDNTELHVAAGRGVIRIDRLQVAGRGEVDGAEFLRGYRLRPGDRFTAGSADDEAGPAGRG